MLAPALMALLGAENYSIIFLVVAVLASTAFLGLMSLAPWPTPLKRDNRLQQGKPLSSSGVLTAALLLSFLILYISHFGVQTGVGNWEPAYLTSIGISESLSLWATSAFWLMMVVGRFIAARLIPLISASHLVTFSSVGMLLSLGLTLIEPTSVWAFALCGLFVGPIFPNGLAWLAQTGHGYGSRFAYVFGGSMLGMAVGPWMIGVAVEKYDAAAIPVALIATSFIALIACIILIYLGRKTHSSRTR